MPVEQHFTELPAHLLKQLVKELEEKGMVVPVLTHHHPNYLDRATLPKSEELVITELSVDCRYAHQVFQWFD